jgi:hypothetical protein
MAVHARSTHEEQPAAALSGAVHVATIDTRLVSAVQARAGARVHEAAGLLSGYYVWCEVLKRAIRRDDQSKVAQALGQVCAAKRKLRQFLVPAVATYA